MNERQALSPRFIDAKEPNVTICILSNINISGKIKFSFKYCSISCQNIIFSKISIQKYAIDISNGLPILLD